jgi:hypothetical protein
MDELARRYILLCLRLDRLVPGFVDSYNGPAELREATAAEPMPLPAYLHDEAIELRAMAATLLEGDDAARRRGRWMDGQLRAIAAQARRADGDEIAYAELVEQLMGVPIVPVPESVLREARARLDDALPGTASWQNGWPRIALACASRRSASSLQSGRRPSACAPSLGARSSCRRERGSTGRRLTTSPGAPSRRSLDTAPRGLS